MSDTSGGSFLKDNWYLVGAFVVVLAVVIVLALRPERSDTPSTAAIPGDSGAASDAREPRYANVPRATEAETAQRVIDEYEALIQENPDAPDNPARLFAAGNLYRQKLMDYAQAAEKYQLILILHPEWEGIAAVYPQLEYCFEQTEDSEGLRWLFTYMTEHMPSDSQEYLYAQLKLSNPEAELPEPVRRSEDYEIEDPLGLDVEFPDDEDAPLEPEAPPAGDDTEAPGEESPPENG